MFLFHEKSEIPHANEKGVVVGRWPQPLRRQRFEKEGSIEGLLCGIPSPGTVDAFPSLCRCPHDEQPYVGFWLKSPLRGHPVRRQTCTRRDVSFRNAQNEHNRLRIICIVKPPSPTRHTAYMYVLFSAILWKTTKDKATVMAVRGLDEGPWEDTGGQPSTTPGSAQYKPSDGSARKRLIMQRRHATLGGRFYRKLTLLRVKVKPTDKIDIYTYVCADSQPFAHYTLPTNIKCVLLEKSRAHRPIS